MCLAKHNLSQLSKLWQLTWTIDKEEEAMQAWTLENWEEDINCVYGQWRHYLIKRDRSPDPSANASNGKSSGLN